MKCNDVHELMPDLATGMTPCSADLEEHLNSCGDCALKLEEFRQTMALLDEWQVPEPSPYFDTRLQANLREEQAKQPAGWLQWIRKPALALSLTVVMVASITLFRGGNPSGSTGKKQVIATSVEPGSAVSDLESLDTNHDLYSDFDVLDDLQVQQDVNANP
jgi:hypothetical protein